MDGSLEALGGRRMTGNPVPAKERLGVFKLPSCSAVGLRLNRYLKLEEYETTVHRDTGVPTAPFS